MKLQKLVLVLLFCNAPLFAMQGIARISGSGSLTHIALKAFQASGSFSGFKIIAKEGNVSGSAKLTACEIETMNSSGSSSFDGCTFGCVAASGSTTIENSTVTGDLESSGSLKAVVTKLKGITSVTSGAQFTDSEIVQIIVRACSANVSVAGVQGIVAGLIGKITCAESVVYINGQQVVTNSSSFASASQKDQITLSGKTTTAQKVIFDSNDGIVYVTKGAKVGQVVGGKVIER